MPSFLALNQETIRESNPLLQRFSLKQTEIIASSVRRSGGVKSTLYRVGAINSSQIELVLKVRDDWHYLDSLFPYELAFIAYLWKNFPDIRAQLPKVYWIVKDTQGKSLWLLIEKFPWNRSDSIYEISYRTMEDQEIIKILKRLWVSEKFIDCLGKSIFSCPSQNEGEIRTMRIGDLEEIWAHLAYDID